MAVKKKQTSKAAIKPRTDEEIYVIVLSAKLPLLLEHNKN